MKNKLLRFLPFLGILVPAIFVFRALLFDGPLAFGDSHYFHPETLKEFVAKPLAWVNRENNFGGVNKIIWIYPLMLLRGLLHILTSLGDVVLAKLIFYIPAVILTATISYSFAKHVGLKRTGAFFASLLYTLNTYFILLVDGGQAGVFLGYGLFPLVLKKLDEFTNKQDTAKFITTALLLFLANVFDPRITLIAFAVFIPWYLARGHQWKKLFSFIPLLAVATLLSSYWIVPFISLGQKEISTAVSSLNLTSILNPLLLFQPHWPANIFGVVNPPPFYFVLVPLLVFGGLLVKAKRKELVWALIFLLFAFLAKGETAPLGGFYSWLVNDLPLGSAFRDSTKFFIPVVLFAGLLIGSTAEKLSRVKGAVAVIYTFILILISPALVGQLRGVLKPRDFDEGLLKVHQSLSEEGGSFRTLWFPQKHPLSFQTEEKPALDAWSLVEETPFALMNTGTYDKFNFLHNEEALSWLELLGVRYLVFSGSENIDLSEEEKENWEDLNERVATMSGFTRKDWGSVPVYETVDPKPKIFGTDRLLVVVGGAKGLEELLENSAMVFAESGNFDVRELEKYPSESIAVVFNVKRVEDLAFSYLQESFLGTSEAVNNEWANYKSEEYLDWKYQLLIRDLVVDGFDYGKGVSLSTNKEEKMVFDLGPKPPGEYILAVRGIQGENAGFTVEVGGRSVEMPLPTDDFEWVWSEVALEEEIGELAITNNSGVVAINTLTLIPKEEWEEAQEFADTLVSPTGVLGLRGALDLGSKWREVDYQMISPVEYKVTIDLPLWIVFTDSYHADWRLGGKSPVSLYSMVNGFYSEPGESTLVFEGQKRVDQALTISLATLALLLGGFFINKWKK